LNGATFPKFIKADGLALGKGAVEVRNFNEAKQVIHDMMIDRKFGQAGTRVVIEDYLGGAESPEISLHALTDGNTYLMFPAAQDHKTIGEGHTGPMTGGMGTVSPLPGISGELVAEYGERIVDPLLRGLQARGINYKGLVYPGLKLQDGQPKVLEYNARFGDPETQVYARLAESGFLTHCLLLVRVRLIRSTYAGVIWLLYVSYLHLPATQNPLKKVCQLMA